MTPAEKNYMDAIVQNIYEQFIKDIASGRKMNIDVVRKLAEGRIYTGTMAKDAGLIDNLGNIYDTVDALKQDLKIKGKPVLVYGERPFSFSKWIFGSLAQDFSKEMTSQLLSSPFKFIMNQ
jgi:protease-4